MNIKSKCLVVGLGNPLLMDDTIGLYVVSILNEDSDLKQLGCFEFIYNYSGGIDLLEDICGYKQVVIIDCFEKLSDDYDYGSCIELNLKDLEASNTNHFINTHGLTLPVLIDLGNKLDLEVPDELKIFGIIGSNCSVFSENLSSVLQAKVHHIIETIKTSLMEWGMTSCGRF